MPHFSVAPNPRIPFTILHEDSDLLVVEKPAGIVTQPGKAHASDSLLNGLFSRYGNALQNLGLARDWGLLHRLDRDTSGLLLVGLRPVAYDALREAFAQRRIKKRYLAIVAGTAPHPRGTIQQPIKEVTGIQKRAVLHREGQPATTSYAILSVATPVSAAEEPRRPHHSTPRFSLLEARPATGRLHQIRVHLASIDCPILGDEMYAPKSARLPSVPRLCLHAAELSFVHPTTNRRLTIQSPFPADLRKILAQLKIPLPLSLSQ